jgi:MFS family permease
VGDAVNNIKIAFKDKKFVVMVVLIGGFWALYSTMLFAIQIIGYGYRWFPAFLTAMALGIPNPMTIILLGPFISKYIEKVESMRVVLGGLMVYLVGLTILGYSLQQWQWIIVGIIIASVGEFMVAPGYLAFISKLAPKDNISAYIGCNFISYMIGLLGGTIAFSAIVNYVGVDLRMPYFFYGILISFGLFLMFAFIMYYRTWGQDVIKRANEIRKLEEGVSLEDEIPSDYIEPIIFRVFDNKIMSFIPLLIIPIILFTSFSFGTFNYIGPEEDEEEVGPIFEWGEISTTESGYTSENNQADVQFEIPEENYRLSWINCTLTWQDESSSFFRGTNRPDEFKLTLINPNGDTISESSMSTSESVSLTTAIDLEENLQEDLMGTWIIVVEAGNCGDDFAIGGFRSSSDDGNDWSLEYSYTFLQESQAE